ncbi:MAG: glutathione S-transferase family protein [Geminicoccaceae bacterium]
MLEVWGRRDASNVLPVMWTIGELSLPHVRYDVGGSFGRADTPAYLAMNPNGKTPTINDRGFILWESNAIVRYLCGCYGAGSLMPDTAQGRATADQWMEWHKTTVYPDYINLFWAIVRTEPALRDSGTIASLSKSLGASLKILDGHLGQQPYVAGDPLTMADIPLGSAIHRYFHLDIARPELPNVTAWHQRLCDRSAYREHVAFPFGTQPAEWYLLERAGVPER